MVFHAANLVLTCGSELLTLQRDDVDHIPFPGLWDLPGGGRENGETATECALRELKEEFGLHLPPDRLETVTAFRSATVPGGVSIVFTGQLGRDDVKAIRFGDEGQGWALMPVRRYIFHPQAVPHFRGRVAHCLSVAGSEHL